MEKLILKSVKILKTISCQSKWSYHQGIRHAFNVNAYAADSLVETTLLEGSVSVSNNANGKQMILKPNETAIYRKSTGILSMHINANAQNEISWREGVLSFNDISMGEIARQLSHH